MEFCDTTSRISDVELKTMFDALSPSDRQPYEIIAERDFECSEFLWDELKELLLLKTKGKVSYKTLAVQMGGIASPNCICKWLQNQDGFKVRKD